MSRKFALILVLICLANISVYPSSAQEDRHKFYDGSIGFIGGSWSSDSNRFFFTDTNNDWHVYIPQHNQSAKILRPPFTVLLTLPQVESFNPLLLEEHTFVTSGSLSPNGKYFAYAINQPQSNDRFPLAVANLETGWMAVTEILIDPLNYFELLWSDDSSAFALYHYQPYFFVTRYISNFDNKIIVKETPTWEMFASDTLDLFDINATGDRVLIRTALGVVFWEPRKNKATLIPMSTRLGDAVFMTSTLIRYIDENGIYELNLETGAKYFLSDKVQLNKSLQVFFSPDGMKLVVSDNSVGNDGETYLVDLRDLATSRSQ
jgi:hypothetical protein